MGKDDERYRYVTFGLLRGSEAEQYFTEDLETYHMIDHPGKMAGLRLTELLLFLHKGILSPTIAAAILKIAGQLEGTGNESEGEIPSRRPSTPRPTQQTHIHKAQNREEIELMSDDIVVVDERKALASADAAADVWEM